jgi:hypothetical protein
MFRQRNFHFSKMFRQRKFHFEKMFRQRKFLQILYDLSEVAFIGWHFYKYPTSLRSSRMSLSPADLGEVKYL